MNQKWERHGEYIVDTKTGVRVADIRPWQGVGGKHDLQTENSIERNAALIEAAPDLHAALASVAELAHPLDDDLLLIDMIPEEVADCIRAVLHRIQAGVSGKIPHEEIEAMRPRPEETGPARAISGKDLIAREIVEAARSGGQPEDVSRRKSSRAFFDACLAKQRKSEK